MNSKTNTPPPLEDLGESQALRSSLKPKQKRAAKTAKKADGQGRQVKEGDVFNMLTVVRRARPQSVRFWVCRCACGTLKTIRKDGLLRTRIGSCGCNFVENARMKSLRHGYAIDGKVATEYTIWSGLKTRCTNPKEKHWHCYGGRGIKVCERWKHSFEAFLADMGPRPSKGHSIDRIDNDGNYEPGNCRWATKDEQYGNRSNSRKITWGGITLCLSQWERRLGLGNQTLRARLRNGWTIEKAFTTP